MATADRLYEVACECRDLETRLEALLRDIHKKEELLLAYRLAGGALIEELGGSRHPDGPLPAGVVRRMEELRHLLP